MRIWVDGDACPKAVKEIIFKCAINRQIPTLVVANSYMKIPVSPFIRLVVVSDSFDAADTHIVENSTVEDLAITSDILLAELLVKKSVSTISFKGQVFTESSIGDAVSMRNLLAEFRGGMEGQISYNPPYGPKEKKAFAAAFDRAVTQLG